MALGARVVPEVAEGGESPGMMACVEEDEDEEAPWSLMCCCCCFCCCWAFRLPVRAMEGAPEEPFWATKDPVWEPPGSDGPFLGFMVRDEMTKPRPPNVRRWMEGDHWAKGLPMR